MNALSIDLTALLAFAAMASGSSLNLADPQPAVEAAQTKIEVRIEDREVVGDHVIRVTEGQLVEIVWISDAKAELHIHGYDIRIDVSPAAPSEVSFVAHATGRFAVTSHGFGDEHGHGHQTLAYIEVYPK